MIVFPHRLDSVIAWLQEFFHPDREDMHINVCLVVSDESAFPRELDKYLNSATVHFRVTKLVGSALVGA